MSNIDEQEKQFLRNKKRLRPKDAAKYLGVSLRTLEVRRSKGLAPSFTKIVGKVFYEVTDLDAFLASQTTHYVASSVDPSEILHADSNAKSKSENKVSPCEEVACDGGFHVSG